MRTSLTDNIILKSIELNKSFLIDFIEVIFSKLSINGSDFRLSSIEITTQEYSYFNFESIEDIKSNLSNKIDFESFTLFFICDSGNSVWINLRPNYYDISESREYIVAVHISSNNAILAENILESIQQLFSNNQFLFNNKNNASENDKVMESSKSIIVNMPDHFSVETTTSQDERNFTDQKDLKNSKKSFIINIILLFLGTVLTLVLNSLFK